MRCAIRESGSAICQLPTNRLQAREADVAGSVLERRPASECPEQIADHHADEPTPQRFGTGKLLPKDKPRRAPHSTAGSDCNGRSAQNFLSGRPPIKSGDFPVAVPLDAGFRAGLIIGHDAQINVSANDRNERKADIRSCPLFRLISCRTPNQTAPATIRVGARTIRRKPFRQVSSLAQSPGASMRRSKPNSGPLRKGSDAAPLNSPVGTAVVAFAHAFELATAAMSAMGRKLI